MKANPVVREEFSSYMKSGNGLRFNVAFRIRAGSDRRCRAERFI